MKFLGINLPRNNYRPYQVWMLVEAAGTVIDKSAWSDADQALAYGTEAAVSRFPGRAVEVLVIETMSRVAVRNRLLVHDGPCSLDSLCEHCRVAVAI